VIESYAVDSRIRRRTHIPRRGHDAWYAASQQRFAVDQIRIGVVRRQRARRRHVLEEAAPKYE